MFLNYFLINKQMDYERGRMEHICYEGGGLRVQRQKAGAKGPAGEENAGLYMTRVFDSRDKETVWNRLSVAALIGENMALEAEVYATDHEWERQMAEKFLLGEGEAKALMENCLKATFLNPQDQLLRGVTGRYLWLRLKLWGNGDGSPYVSRIGVYFGGKSWLHMLPEFYQDRGDFLERFLWVFQNIYEEMEGLIRADTMLYDPQATKDGLLNWLAGWLDLDNSYLWRKESLRDFLSQSAYVYDRRGTKRGLKRLVSLYTGEEPFLWENSDNPDEFTLFVRQSCVGTPGEYHALLGVVREGKPAHMAVRLVVLKPYLFLGSNTYIGINSALNRYRTAVLGETPQLSYVVLGGKKGE